MYQTLFACVYVSNRSSYVDDPELKAFIEGMLYLINNYYQKAQQTAILRDEDVNFPHTTEHFAHECHPVLKDVPVQTIISELQTLSEQGSSEFTPYLSWMFAMILAAGWTLEPASLDFIKNAATSQASQGGSKNKKKK